MVIDVVVADVAPSGVGVVIDVIHTEPVVDPAATLRITHLFAKVGGHAIVQHVVDLVPSVVVGEQARIDHPLDCGLPACEVNLAILQTAKHRRARIKFEAEHGPQPLKGGVQRLMKRTFSVNAMDNLDGPRHATPFGIITAILDNATEQRIPGIGPRHGEPSDCGGRGSTPLCPALTVSPMMREGWISPGSWPPPTSPRGRPPFHLAMMLKVLLGG